MRDLLRYIGLYFFVPGYGWTVSAFTVPAIRGDLRPADDPSLSTRFKPRVNSSNPGSASKIKSNLHAMGSVESMVPSFNLPFVIPDALIDWSSVCFAGCLMLFYHVKLYLRERAGKRTWRSAQADTREKWAAYVRETEGWLYAIQTLRNAITAQTFLATTVLSLLTVIGGRLWEIFQRLSGTNLLVAQSALIACSMISSAYYFLQSARLMTHAGFMFPVEPKNTKVDRIMRKSENAQWLGLRCVYLSGGLLSWIVGGPRVFLVSSVMLYLFFRSVDQVPQSIDDDYVFII